MRDIPDWQLWISEHIICPIFGHKWEYWLVIGKDKCARCLVPRVEESHKSFSKMDKIRSRSLAPDGKTVITGRAGMKLNDAKKRAAERKR